VCDSDLPRKFSMSARRVSHQGRLPWVPIVGKQERGTAVLGYLAQPARQANHQAPAAMSAVAGMVMIQATTIFRATPQRTAETR
jgi:hypothetical protein